MFSESGLRDLPSDERERLQKAVVEPVSANPPSLVGKGVFSYRFARAKDDPSTTAWLLEFYKSVRFVGMTAPIDAVAAAGTSAGGGPVAPRRNPS